ncbi:MAG TPA: tetratricopeptide repeat protein [Terracidiphilus sp.]
MHRPHFVRRLPALLSIAVFASLWCTGAAQSPTAETSAATAAQSGSASETPATQSQPAAVHPALTLVVTPPDPTTPEDEGDALMARKRYQAAIVAYKKVSPATATSWNKMGVAYQMMFSLDEAQRCYQQSLKLEPKNSTVLNNLGTVYDSQKNYGAAEKMYRKALKIDPNSALIYKNLGTELLARHKYKKGWEAYKAALAIDPNIFTRSSRLKVENTASVQERGAMNYYMARGCVRAGLHERAIEYLRAALNEGFTTPKMIIADHEFAILRGNPAFEQLLAAQKAPEAH